MSPPILEAHHLALSFPRPGGGHLRVLDGICLTVREGEVVSLVGPSGCGKTSLLHILGGLREPTAGYALLRGAQVRTPPRDVVFVFQDYARSLLPWRSVANNVRLAVDNLGLSRRERDHRVTESLEAVGLEAFAGYSPHELSGGMQQRVALARALARDADVLLMDEPFSSVDAMTRSELQDLLLEVWTALGKTIVFVTHDIDEAIYLAGAVIVLGPRPSQVLARMDVDLPFPRDQLRSRENVEFTRYRRLIHELLARAEPDA